MKQLSEVKKLQKIAGILKEDVSGASPNPLAQKFQDLGLDPNQKVYIAEMYNDFADTMVHGMCLSFNEAVNHINDSYDFVDASTDPDVQEKLDANVQAFTIDSMEEDVKSELESNGLLDKLNFKITVTDEIGGEGIAYLSSCNGNLPDFGDGGEGEEDW